MGANNLYSAAQFTERYRLGSPFSLDDDKAYQSWREYKLEHYPANVGDLVVEVKDPSNLTPAEFEALQTRVVRTNMALYSGQTSFDPDKSIPARLGKRFGLTELDDNMGADDGVTSLKVVSGQWRKGYIPYTNKPIHWHTDGYYNSLDFQIRALLLHCVLPAAKGGENALLDHEVAYIQLRDLNPDFIRVLMAKDVMMIPANMQDGKEIRPDRNGPVFSVMPDGNLHMRYTARIRSIAWKNDTITQGAVKALAGLLDSDSSYIYRATLQSGQGLISNNVLHDRSGFEDGDRRGRLLYRLRYYQRIAGS